MTSGLIDPPPADFGPWPLLAATVIRYWPCLLLLVVSVVLGRRGSGDSQRAPWLGMPFVLLAAIANRHLFESLYYGSTQLHLWHDFFLAALGFALLAIPCTAAAYSRRTAVNIWFVGPALALLATLLDHAFFLFLLTDVSTWLERAA